MQESIFIAVFMSKNNILNGDFLVEFILNGDFPVEKEICKYSDKLRLVYLKPSIFDGFKSLKNAFVSAVLGVAEYYDLTLWLLSVFCEEKNDKILKKLQRNLCGRILHFFHLLCQINIF